MGRRRYAELEKILSTLINRTKSGDAECNLDLSYIKSLYDQQKGKCALTGVNLRIDSYRMGRFSPYKVSIDRIDKTKSHVKGNVQLVTGLSNFIKSDHDIDDLFVTLQNMTDTLLEKGIQTTINKDNSLNFKRIIQESAGFGDEVIIKVVPSNG